MRILRTVAGNRDLARLELVWVCVSLVKWALAILISLYAYREGGATAVGVAALVRLLPRAVFAPRLSLLVDQRSRRRVLLGSVLLRAALAIGMTAVVWAEGSLALLLVLAGMYGLGTAVQKPAQAALLGVHARNPGELASANTLWSILDNAAFVAGSLLVGSVVALGGLPQGFLACVPPLLVGSIVAWRLTPDAPHPPLPGTRRMDEATAGVRALAGDPRLLLLIGVVVVATFVKALVDVLVVVAALGILDMGEQGAGWLSAALGVGGVAGGAAGAVLLARRRFGWALLAGLVLGGLPLVGIGLWPEQEQALVMIALLGVGLGVLEVALLTLIQRLVAVDVIGRVYGVQESLTVAAMALGSVTAAGLVVLGGEAGALMAAGLVLPLLAVVLLGGVRRLDTGLGAPEDVFEAMRGVPAFANLSVATLETLARRADRVAFGPGRVVVRQGEPGDTFYVISSGAVEVFEDGVLQRAQGAGDYFGEIALLHEVSRTATVRTVEPTELLALEQDEFLAAVGAHPRTWHVLHDTASDRLSTVDAGPG